MSTFTARALGALVAITLAASSANAAEIWSDNKSKLIFVKGQIVAGDFDRFAKVADKKPPGWWVVFNSVGGTVNEALMIGLGVRAKHFDTVVVETCRSACALAWLAGVNRGVFSNATVGFHSARNKDTGAPANGSNAMIGAYLGKLGFSYQTIYQLTDAAPDEMDWLDDEKAKKLGIKVSVFDPPKSNTPTKSNPPRRAEQQE